MCDDLGRWILTAEHLKFLGREPLVDLAIPEANGEYGRTIIKTADPERYGINLNDYIVS